MQNSWNRIIAMAAVGSSIILTTGCSDGPFFAMKAINPYYRKQWNDDRQVGPTFVDRVEELKLLRSQVRSMSSEEQLRWTNELSALIERETSPAIRRYAVLTLAEIPIPAAVQALDAASKDQSEKVRMAVCESLKKHEGPASLELLAQMSTSDASTNVKRAAIESLGELHGESVVQALGRSLNDKSVALQYQSTQSLEKVTGQKLGADVSAWKTYLAGGEVTPRTPTIAETINGLNPLQR